MSDEDIELKNQQALAAISAINHINLTHIATLSDPEYFRGSIERLGYLITGFAGTGKSVVLAKIWDALTTKSDKVGSVVTLTSRAAENLVEKGVPCTTYHSLLYKAILDDKGNLVRFELKDMQEIREAVGDFIIFEEVGFMSSDIIEKIADLSIPILMVGDGDQLPSIDGESVFKLIEKEKNPMTVPIMFLEEILRSSKDSSIPYFCNHIRKHGTFNWKLAGNDVHRISKKDLNLKWFKENWTDWDLIICGQNKTRRKYNRIVRAALGYHSEIPSIGERVLCLQNNVVAGNAISNGDLFEVVNAFSGKSVSSFQVKKIKKNGKFGAILTVNVCNNMWDEEVPMEEHTERGKYQQFTFGYAMTCHKMQGSEISRAIFVDEDISFFLATKPFRYSSCTRAAEKLLVAM